MKNTARNVAKARTDSDPLIKMVKQIPGIHFRELLRVSGLANATLQRRLESLEKLGKLSTHRSGSFTRYYGRDVSKTDMHLLQYLKRQPYREIIILMLDSANDTFTFKKIVSELGKSPSTVSAQLLKLIKDNVVRYDEELGYALNDRRAVKKVMSKYRFNGL
jgi:predicted transcriptional regulator